MMKLLHPRTGKNLVIQTAKIGDFVNITPLLAHLQKKRCAAQPQRCAAGGARRYAGNPLVYRRLQKQPDEEVSAGVAAS
ncbi:hypothetical protein OJE16_22775 [Pantoea tagorei]